jgi:hypothetical protein
MDIIGTLEKELIKFYKTHESLDGMIKEVYTYLPQNPIYPFAKINSINKKRDIDSMDGLGYVEVELSICTNCTTNSTCIDIVNKLDGIDMNDAINIEGLDHHYFRSQDRKILQNDDGLWRVDLLVSLIYLCITLNSLSKIDVK